MASLFSRYPKYIYSTFTIIHNHCFRNILIENKFLTIKSCNSWSTIDQRHKTHKVHRSDSGDGDFDTSKLKLISKLNLSEEDALPFSKLPTRSLLQIYNCTKSDEKMGFCKNRLYYISSRLKCRPDMLRESLAKRTFIYNLPFDWLESSLNVLLVSSERILRDLWVLKYHPKTIQERLQKVKSMGVETLYPWMVRCTEQILNRYIEILKETKTILGENQSTQLYLANRLNVSPKYVEEMCEKVPALRTIRVTKLKSFLDFLISEGFTIEDIARRPRVLIASQKTVQQRLEKLRSLGLKEINLNTVSRSRKDFKKYFVSLESVLVQN
ncbi:PREDICTED: uncharacterized protein LOC106099749 isoform X2 [Papilio polytes]|uniref:uncharacterized protein LOC106099749 isoform X2 n=1 Tax=Papilio polytes TaxID=76194 RepID=UPI00067605E8|nr:PREDICTED: uncharacterized protein LOC106099749 isoform X2 [Papilio polytes]